MKGINGRKYNLIFYVQGIHMDMVIPKIVKPNEVYMSFGTKKNGVGIHDFKGKECNL